MPVSTSAPSPDRPSSFTRLPSLTGMRFVAAVLVFFFHSSLMGPEPINPFSGDAAETYAQVVSKAGWVGVSFFFILSGFVLTYSARPHDTPRRFIRRRVAKLFPNHAVTFAAAMILFAAATTTWRQWLPNLFMVHPWVPRADTYISVNPPSWSLGCELFFYLCFPLLYRWIKKISPARLWVWAAGVVAAVIVVPALGYGLLPGGTMPTGFPVSEVQYWAVYMLPPVRTLEFVLGILLARMVLSGRWIRIPLVPVVLLLVTGYVLSFQVPWLYGLNATVVIPLALLIPTMAVRDLRGDSSLFRGRVMLWLGEVSFAFYMVHGVVLTEVRKLIGFDTSFSSAAGAAVILLYLAVSLGFAWLLHTGVENPAMKRWSKPRHPETTPSVEAAAATSRPSSSEDIQPQPVGR
ncbi:acyltransferase [Streptomyces sp. NBC_00237]|uniref:acyltransferase family protein n=1 Tax=Streptomyces sp. NBC_00237 TaxID=2975687 RepID=UPI0022596990|nr:acyltransferase [Streptomyces sp. NBC_00237]MCX5206715.1 acyltransferase [Streptomyces sp. NBC_00237]